MEKSTRQLLEDAGIDVADGLERVMGKEKLYLGLLRRFKSTSKFQSFLDAMQRGDVDEAFLALHNEKGVAANLSLEDYYSACYSAVEELRAARKEMNEKGGRDDAHDNAALRVPSNLRQLIVEHTRVSRAIDQLPE